MENKIVVDQNSDVSMFEMGFASKGFCLEGVDYSYYASGTSKRVFVSNDKTHVIKISSDDENEYFTSLLLSEADIWSKANQHQRKFIAKTEIINLSVPAIKQEFVEVSNYLGNLGGVMNREIGIRTLEDGEKEYVMFDMDILAENGEEPYRGYYFGSAEESVRQHLVELKNVEARSNKALNAVSDILKGMFPDAEHRVAKKQLKPTYMPYTQIIGRGTDTEFSVSTNLFIFSNSEGLLPIESEKADFDLGETSHGVLTAFELLEGLSYSVIVVKIAITRPCGHSYDTYEVVSKW